jgi:hypothetical protein|tara:strand:- start:35 stop:958 length:924 start_codon:yes stop_codon:yes gene_type:complete
MSGGGGSSSDGGGGNDMQVSGMEAAYSNEAGISTHAESKTGSTAGYTGSDAGWAANDNTPDTSTVGIAGGNVNSDDEYDEPDKAHYNQTQKDISNVNKTLAENNQIDTKMSKEEYDKFNKDLNKYYGTENKKYEPYGRAGEGTVNLSFKEHWDNVGMQSPALKFSPTLRFLAAAGKNVGEYLTSDYGTYKYAGPGTDSGGLLGGFGSGGSGEVSSQDREIMKNIAPEAPYIVSGIAKPSNSPAANWYNGLGNTSTNPGGFDLATEYANAKSAVAKTLNNKGPIAMLAVNDSPFYDWLKTKSLDRGIL